MHIVSSVVSLAAAWQFRHVKPAALVLGAVSLRSIYSTYEKISIVRNIQLVQAGQDVENKVIERYISGLLDICYRHNIPNNSDLRMEFFENYGGDKLAQLQMCVEQVLIEKGICKQKEDGSGIEGIGDLRDEGSLGPFEFVLPLHSGRGVYYPKLKLLCTILSDSKNREMSFSGPETLSRILNEILGYTSPAESENIKGDSI